MAITIRDVEHIAELARLDLTAEEKSGYASQLGQILDYFDQLRRVDTSGVPPLSHPLDLVNVLRDDQVQESKPTEEILENAPDRRDGCVRVPVILDQ